MLSTTQLTKRPLRDLLRLLSSEHLVGARHVWKEPDRPGYLFFFSFFVNVGGRPSTFLSFSWACVCLGLLLDLVVRCSMPQEVHCHLLCLCEKPTFFFFSFSFARSVSCVLKPVLGSVVVPAGYRLFYRADSGCEPFLGGSG